MQHAERWAASTGAAIARSSRVTLSGAIGPSARSTARRSRPRTYSITRNAAPSASVP